MPNPDTILQRLASAARRDVSAPGELPFGMATRVLANVGREAALIVWERLGWRTLASALGICALCVWWDAATPAHSEDDVLVNQIATASFNP
jgi:hypothetical protein